MFLLLFSSLLLCSANSLNILVVSLKFGTSHMTFMGAIADTLQLAGHNVTVLMPEYIPDSYYSFTKVSHASVVRIPLSYEKLLPALHASVALFGESFSDRSIDSTTQIPVSNSFNHFRAIGCNATLSSQGLKEFKENSPKFDVAIAEFYGVCGMAIMDYLGIERTIGALSFVSYPHIQNTLGIPTPPSYIPSVGFGRTSSTSFTGRLLNFGSYILDSLYLTVEGGEEGGVVRERMPHARSTREMMDSASLVFTNSVPFLDLPRPTSNKVVEIGGITVGNPKPVPKDISDYFTLRPYTVVISFGTVAKWNFMPKKMLNNLLEVIESNSDVTFLWPLRIPGAKEPNFTAPSNLILTGRIPLYDIICDSRISAFISHGGLGSITEASSAGVPTLVIPIFGDQFYNSFMVEKRRFGRMIQKEDIEGGILAEAIRDIITNQSYRTAAHRIREMHKLRPFSPRELLVRNVEFAAKFGSFSDIEGRNLSFVEYYNLDILGVVFVLFVFIVSTVIWSSVLFISYILKSKKKYKQV